MITSLKERITFSHIINIIANTIGMVLVIKPSFIFANDINASGRLITDEIQTTALYYITFSALFFLSNTYVVDRSLKGITILLGDFSSLLIKEKCLAMLNSGEIHNHISTFRSTCNYVTSLCWYWWFHHINYNGIMERWLRTSKGDLRYPDNLTGRNV